jgi:ribosomal protein S18 acetylase RimI-like enzyme
MIHYREVVDKDVPRLHDICLKCYEKPPATSEWWNYIFKNKQAGCIVACKSQVPIGMMVWERQAFKLPDFQTKEITLHAHILCVRKEFRSNGIGQRLLAHGHEIALSQQCKYITMSIPEYQCKPDTPEDVSKWLNDRGFKAKVILPTKIEMYGKHFDQYLFVFEVQA